MSNKRDPDKRQEADLAKCTDPSGSGSIILLKGEKRNDSWQCRVPAPWFSPGLRIRISLMQIRIQLFTQRRIPGSGSSFKNNADPDLQLRFSECNNSSRLSPHNDSLGYNRTFRSPFLILDSYRTSQHKLSHFNIRTQTLTKLCKYNCSNWRRKKCRLQSRAKIC